MQNERRMGMEETMNPGTYVFDLLDDTDGRIKELESTTRLLAVGLKEATGDTMTEDAILHIANCLQDIRGQLDEATAAAMQIIRRAVA